MGTQRREGRCLGGAVRAPVVGVAGVDSEDRREGCEQAQGCKNQDEFHGPHLLS